MKALDNIRVLLALIHYPVYNKAGDVIASAVSNLDLHDISRAAKTYGVEAFYVVTPLVDQQELIKKITSHWTKGAGGKYNPDRKEALELINVAASFDDVVKEISDNGPGRLVTVVTDAHAHRENIDCDRLCEILKAGETLLLLFGTSWGLTREFIEEADYVLAPIMGPTAYNHLSVRCAAAIILDRLLGVET